MELIKEIVIENPPTFYTIKKKRESEKLGHDVFDKHYLTANLFFNNNLSFFVVSKIIRECKKFLLEKSGYIPPLEKMRLEIEIHASKHIDLDNRAYFWKKLFMDILKTPTSKQLAKASEKNREIVTMNVIYDDSTQYVDDFRETFKYGGNFLIFRIYGRIKSEQKELDLFFK